MTQLCSLTSYSTANFSKTGCWWLCCSWWDHCARLWFSLAVHVAIVLHCCWQIRIITDPILSKIKLAVRSSMAIVPPGCARLGARRSCSTTTHLLFFLARLKETAPNFKSEWKTYEFCIYFTVWFMLKVSAVLIKYSTCLEFYLLPVSWIQRQNLINRTLTTLSTTIEFDVISLMHMKWNNIMIQDSLPNKFWFNHLMTSEIKVCELISKEEL